MSLSTPKARKTPEQAVIDQEFWIDNHGGDLAGYVARYGELRGAENYATDTRDLAWFRGQLKTR